MQSHLVRRQESSSSSSSLSFCGRDQVDGLHQRRVLGEKELKKVKRETERKRRRASEQNPSGKALNTKRSSIGYNNEANDQTGDAIEAVKQVESVSSRNAAAMKRCTCSCKSAPNLCNHEAFEQRTGNTVVDKETQEGEKEQCCRSCKRIEECPWCQTRKSHSIEAGVSLASANLNYNNGTDAADDIGDEQLLLSGSGGAARCCVCCCGSPVPSVTITKGGGHTGGGAADTLVGKQYQQGKSKLHCTTLRPDKTTTIAMSRTSSVQLKRSTFV